MKQTDISIKNKDNEQTYIETTQGICGDMDNHRVAAFSAQIAENRLIGEVLKDAREVVEKEALLVYEALDIALSEKSKRLNSLNALIEKVSSESAFMKTALNTVNAKTVEIESINRVLSEFIGLVSQVNHLFESGAIDRVSKIASAIHGDKK